MKKKSDLVFLLLALAIVGFMGYLYGSGEGRRVLANQCVFAQEFAVGGRLFYCEEVSPPAEEGVKL